MNRLIPAVTSRADCFQDAEMNRYNPLNLKQGMFMAKAERKRRDKVGTRNLNFDIAIMLT